MNRQPGYYWVKMKRMVLVDDYYTSKEAWTIAEWRREEYTHCFEWQLTGYDVGIRDENFIEINESRIPSPDDVGKYCPPVPPPPPRKMVEVGEMKLVQTSYTVPEELRAMQGKINDLASVLITNFLELEQQVCNKVLEQILCRPATIEDYKQCTRIQYHDHIYTGEWYFCYQNIQLGKIKRHFAPDFKIEFIPT